MDGNNKFNSNSKVKLGVKVDAYQEELLLRKTPRVVEFRYYSINPDPMVQEDLIKRANAGSLSDDTDLKSITEWAFYIQTENGKGMIYHQNQPASGVINKGPHKKVLSEFVEEHTGQLYSPDFFVRTLPKKAMDGHTKQLQRHLNKLYEFLSTGKKLRGDITDKILKVEGKNKVHDLLPDINLPSGQVVRPVQLCHNHTINNCPILIKNTKSATFLLDLFERELKTLVSRHKKNVKSIKDSNTSLKDKSKIQPIPQKSELATEAETRLKTLIPKDWSTKSELDKEIYARGVFWEIVKVAIEPFDFSGLVPLEKRMKAYFEAFAYSDFGFAFIAKMFTFNSVTVDHIDGSYGIFQAMGLTGYQSSFQPPVGSPNPAISRLLNLDGSHTNEEAKEFADFHEYKYKLYSDNTTVAGMNNARFKKPFPMSYGANDNPKYKTDGQLMFPLAIFFHEMAHTKIGIPYHETEENPPTVKDLLPIELEVKVMDEYENRVRIMYGFRPRLLYTMPDKPTAHKQCSKYYADKTVDANSFAAGNCKHPNGWLY